MSDNKPVLSQEEIIALNTQPLTKAERLKLSDAIFATPVDERRKHQDALIDWLFGDDDDDKPMPVLSILRDS